MNAQRNGSLRMHVVSPLSPPPPPPPPEISEKCVSYIKISYGGVDILYPFSCNFYTLVLMYISYQHWPPSSLYRSLLPPLSVNVVHVSIKYTHQQHACTSSPPPPQNTTLFHLPGGRLASVGF